MTTTTGSYADTYTGSASADWSMIIAEFKPAEGGGSGSSSTATVYPTKYYNTDGLTATKHIITPAGQLVATIQGTAGSHDIFYASSDYIGSSNIFTNIANGISELLDYFPFGNIRIDEGMHNDQRKYIGEEYDADTGLNYLNARYYNSSRGQFTSQDPMFWQLPADLLADPQQLNSYSYARNNPIVMSDPTGERVELISRKVFNFFGRPIGAHTFFKITPDNPNEISILGLPEGATEFTLGGYRGEGSWRKNKLIKQIGTKKTSGDKKWAFEGEEVLNSATIDPPDGQSDTEFINNMGEKFNNIDLTEMNYRGLGNYEGLYNANSNNYAYTLGVNSGVKDQMDAFNPNPDFIVGASAPGYGTVLPKTSIFQQMKTALANIQNKINSLFSK